MDIFFDDDCVLSDYFNLLLNLLGICCGTHLLKTPVAFSRNPAKAAILCVMCVMSQSVAVIWCQL
jgi:hypothetical protein